MTLKGRNIIIVGQQPWDVDIGSNCKNIALELSKYHRILYVNAPLDRITKIRFRKDPKVKKRVEIIKSKNNGLEKVQENLWVLYPNILIESINWIRIGSLFSLFNLINNKRFAKTITRASKALNFVDFILFNDNDIFRSFYLKELLQPDLAVYYIRDYMIATPYWKRHGKKLEPKLIEKSDLVLSNSEFLKRYSEKYNPNSYYVAQGFDFDLFKDSKRVCPDDMNHIVGPVIGYFGALTSLRLDIELIQHIADCFPMYSIVLIGPQDAAFEKSNLHGFSNVFFLGAKDPSEIFNYINCFDVCINPQLVNELTIGNYPRKVDEYLALGKPVVATWTETMESFKDFVYLAKKPGEFITSIQNALEENSERKQRAREEFALSHTWENAVGNILRCIEKHLSNESRTLNYDA